YRLQQNPLTDLGNGPGSLQQRHEQRRRYQALLRVLPAQQRLKALNAAAADIDLRLIVEQKLLAFQSARQPRFEREAACRGSLREQSVQNVLLVAFAS